MIGRGAGRPEADGGEQGTPAKAGARSCRRHAAGKGRAICGRSCWRASTGCLRSSAAGAADGCTLVGFITKPLPARQILEHTGERTTASAIASARSPPLALNGQQLAAPEGVFEAIPELEFDQTANLAAEADHYQWTRRAGAAKRIGGCGAGAGGVR